MIKKVEVSHRTIIFTVFFLLLLGFLYYIREIILVVFVALLIMAVLNPMVTKLSKRKVPRGISVILVYILALALLSLIVASVVPPLVEQTSKLFSNLPSYFQEIGVSGLISNELAREVVAQFGTLPPQIVKFGLSIFSNVLAVLSVLILAFYLLMIRDKLGEAVESVVGASKAKAIINTIDNLERSLGGWARGELSLMFIVGSAIFLGLTLLGIPYAVPLGLIAGVLEIIPNFGPVFSAIPAVIIGFGISPFIGIATIALYVLVQQIENYVIVPKVMQKSAGVNPVVTIICLAVGLKVAGVVGVLISVPVYITLQVVLQEYLSRK